MDMNFILGVIGACIIVMLFFLTDPLELKAKKAAKEKHKNNVIDLEEKIKEHQKKSNG